MDTKTRILDAAEYLFGEKGIAGTSLRAITHEAGVNLAAVNYHFQSKDALVQAVIARRMQPINERRLEMLAELETTVGEDQPLPLKGVLRVVLEPVLRLAYRVGQEHANNFRKLFGRMFADPAMGPKMLFRAEMAGTIKILTGAFRRALPGCPEEEIWWGVNFVMGSMSHSLVSGPFIEVLSGGLCNPNEGERLLERILSFAAAGMSALAADASPDGETKHA